LHESNAGGFIRGCCAFFQRQHRAQTRQRAKKSRIHRLLTMTEGFRGFGEFDRCGQGLIKVDGRFA
jgi:hypothetical protein